MIKIVQISVVMFLGGILLACETTVKRSIDKKMVQKAQPLKTKVLPNTVLDQVENKEQQAQDYLLSAQSHVENKQYAAGERLLNKIKIEHLTEKNIHTYLLLLAEIAILHGQLDVALDYFKRLSVSLLTKNQQKKLYRLSVYIYEKKSDKLQTAIHRLYLTAYVEDAMLQARQYELAWSLLIQVEKERLIHFRDQTTNTDELNAWLDLALLYESEKSQQRKIAEMNQWKSDHLEHPATDYLLTNLIRKTEIEAFQPKNIGVFIPLTGYYQGAGKQLREGVIAAWYDDTSENKPQLTLLDSGKKITNIPQLYQQAVTYGVDFMIGPLRKPVIQALLKNNQVSVPTLSLNFTDENEDFSVLEGNNFFQFALSPEDEIEQLAEYAWQQGHRKVAVIMPENNRGLRMFDAFEQNWEEIGGEVLESKLYQSKDKDFSKPVEKLLNIDKSKLRQKQLEKLLSQKLSSQSRRRQDIDFIVLVASKDKAPLIRPQFKYYGASGLPILSTSSVYEANVKKRSGEVNGLVFNVMPWQLSDSEIPETVLQAMGMDAYALINQLNRMKVGNKSFVAGKTGDLWMDINHRVHRELWWAHYANKRVVAHERQINDTVTR
jgi:uncharacterized protein